MMLAHALFTVLVAATPPDSLLSADSLLVELRKGGYTILWRHTATDRTVREPMNYETTPRFQQRNLTDRGVADAKAVGLLFKSREIPIGEVLASPMFRTRETAEYAFGRVEATPILRQLDPSPEQRRLIAAEPAAGTNRVLVTHHFVIERNVPGIKPGQLVEGEAVVIRATRGDSVRTVGIFKMDDWQRLAGRLDSPAAATGGGHRAPLTIGHGAPPSTRPPSPATDGPLVIPAALETPRNAAIADYLRTFNTGDAARMRKFYERSVVPNPARTMDERMEVYDRLKGNLGTLSIVSVDTVEANRVVVTLQGSAGTPAIATFTVEAQAPHRLTTITFQVGGG
jgi:phosphohistidine phosphatase SixA